MILHDKQSGYVGLIVLIISVAIIAILFWRDDIFSGDDKSNIDEKLEMNDDAEEVKRMMERESENNIKEIEKY